MRDLLADLLDWQAAMAAHGFPAEEVLAPGLPPGGAAAMLAGAGLPAAADAVAWFAWHDGLRPGAPRAALAPSPYVPVGLADALLLRERLRATAADAARAAGRGRPPEYYWEPSWLPLGRDPGGAVLVVGLVADTSRTGPLRRADPAAPVPRLPVALHLREAAAVWTQALGTGAWTWDGAAGPWRLDADLLPARLRHPLLEGSGPDRRDLPAPGGPAAPGEGWRGRVTLTAQPEQVTPVQPGTTLAARMEPPVGAPYVVTLYDGDLNVGSVAPPAGGTLAEHRWERRLPSGSTHAYQVFVARDSPTYAPPEDDVRARGEAAAASVEWHGAVVLTAEPGSADSAGGPGAPGSRAVAVVARLYPELVGPYAVTLYEDERRVGSSCPPAGGRLAECRWERTPDPGTTCVYRAYVAADSPAARPPLVDLHTWAALRVADGEGLGAARMAVDGVGLDALAALVDASTPEQVRAAFPQARPAGRRGTVDRYAVYAAARAAGASTKDALLAAVAEGVGAAHLFILWVRLHPAPPAPDPRTQPPLGPVPPVPDPHEHPHVHGAPWAL